jgi:hypothetical protein
MKWRLGYSKSFALLRFRISVASTSWNGGEKEKPRAKPSWHNHHHL